MRCAEAEELAPAYVLGALDATEMAAVRAHLATCENEHAEFNQLGAIVPGLFETIEPVDPPPALGERIMAAARDDRAGQIEAAWRPSHSTEGRRAEVPAAIARRRVSPYTWVAVALAAVVALAALGIWNLQLRGQVDELAAYRDAVAGVIDRASAGGQIAILRDQASLGMAPPPAGIAGIGQDGTIAVAMSNLSPTSGAEVYEVWVIGGNGTPVPMGSFTVGPDNVGGTVTVSGTTERGVTIALTHEPKPGATTPTQPIIALGQAQEPGG
jgi:anti-sigma-K factor RskA